MRFSYSRCKEIKWTNIDAAYPILSQAVLVQTAVPQYKCYISKWIFALMFLTNSEVCIKRQYVRLKNEETKNPLRVKFIHKSIVKWEISDFWLKKIKSDFVAVFISIWYNWFDLLEVFSSKNSKKKFGQNTNYFAEEFGASRKPNYQ